MARWQVEKILSPVIVRWIDSQTIDGWQDRAVDLSESLLCTTYGYLIAASEDRMVVAQSMSPDGKEVNGQLVIPRLAVQSIEWIGGKATPQRKQ